MTAAAATLELCARLRHFARDRRGVAAIEFAILLPVMITLYIGGVEIGDGIAIQFKSTLAARTVANLAAEYNNSDNTIDTTTMSSILGAASAVMSPYPTSSLTVTVSEVTTDANGNATITWSCSLNGTAHTVGSSATLPAGVQTPSISVIWGEVSYPYQPQIGYVITGTINIYQSIYFYPRMSTSVSGPSSCPTS